MNRRIQKKCYLIRLTLIFCVTIKYFYVTYSILSKYTAVDERVGSKYENGPLEVIHKLSVISSNQGKTKEDLGHWIHYRSSNGVGHRLTRMAAAFHIAIVQSSKSHIMISHIKPDWKNCAHRPGLADKEYKSYIWETLFGPENVSVPTDLKVEDVLQCATKSFYNNTPDKNIPITFNNDVPGYFPQHTIPYTIVKKLERIIATKLQTDSHFYSNLQTRFRQRHHIQFHQFFNKYNFKDFFVIGLHLRVGSNHDSDFHTKKRGIQDQHIYCDSIIQLIIQIVQDKRLIQHKPIMLFVASDNQQIIEFLNRTIHDQNVPITLATNYQPNQLKFDGFSFYSENNETTSNYAACMENWKNSIMDMVLLSMSDLVIAGMYSSFVQSMPLSLAFKKLPYYSTNLSNYNPNPVLPSPVYCEVSSNGNAATCHSSYTSILNSSYTIENETTFFYGERSPNWTVNSRHRNENVIPLSCYYCKNSPFLC